jgi:large subunit ribosomal protein L23
MIQLFKNLVLTEKSVRLIMKYNQYTFDVDVKLTKPQIKKISQNVFKGEVLSVNTHRPPRKKRRLGLSQGYKPSKKRVIIKFKNVERIKLDTKQNKQNKKVDMGRALRLQKARSKTKQAKFSQINTNELLKDKRGLLKGEAL